MTPDQLEKELRAIRKLLKCLSCDITGLTTVVGGLTSSTTTTTTTP